MGDSTKVGRGIWLYRLAVLALPLMVLWHQDNSLFTPPGQIDPWFYLGYFRNLVNFKRDLFSNTYYGSRLSWILPGWLVHTVFPPVFASAVLHLGVLWTASLALFETLRITTGARSAFLTTLVFTATPQVWYAAGWDYFDGAGIAYCLVALALFTAAAARPGRRWMLVLAGASIAGLVYANVLLALVAPFLLLSYAGLARAWRRLPLTTILVDLGLWAGGGFLMVTLVLCGINHSLDGTFWFYGPSFEIMPRLVHRNRWDQQPWISYGLAPWLWFAAIAAGTAVIQVVTTLRRTVTAPSAVPLLFSIQLLLLLALDTCVQRWRMNVLGLPFYASMLLPFVFLVIGSSFWRTAEQISQRSYVLLCGAAVLAFGAVWYDYAGDWTPMWPAAIWPAASIGAATLAAALLLQRRALGMLLAIAGFALFSAEVRYIPKRQNSSAAEIARPDGPHAYREMLERLVDTRGWIESERGTRGVRFWYDLDEPPSDDYLALSSTYLYLYSSWPQPFPQLACDQQALEPDRLVVVQSIRDRAGEIASRVLSDCLAPAALVAEVKGIRTDRHPSGPYTTVLFTVERDPSKWRRVRPVFDSSGKAAMELNGYSAAALAFPPDRWTALETGHGTRLRSGPEGTTLQTATIAHAGAAFYGPLVAPASGRYYFTARFRLLAGAFAFGVRTGDGARWLATDTVGHRAGLDMERECWVDLEKGQEIRVEIANNNTVDAPASLVIKELTALEVAVK